jgi:hypothetical protein
MIARQQPIFALRVNHSSQPRVERHRGTLLLDTAPVCLLVDLGVNGAGIATGAGRISRVPSRLRSGYRWAVIAVFSHRPSRPLCTEI